MNYTAKDILVVMLQNGAEQCTRTCSAGPLFPHQTLGSDLFRHSAPPFKITLQGDSFAKFSVLRSERRNRLIIIFPPFLSGILSMKVFRNPECVYLHYFNHRCPRWIIIISNSLCADSIAPTKYHVWGFIGALQPRVEFRFGYFHIFQGIALSFILPMVCIYVCHVFQVGHTMPSRKRERKGQSVADVLH